MSTRPSASSVALAAMRGAVMEGATPKAPRRGVAAGTGVGASVGVGVGDGLALGGGEPHAATATITANAANALWRTNRRRNSGTLP